jgi:hypothetical protein
MYCDVEGKVESDYAEWEVSYMVTVLSIVEFVGVSATAGLMTT